jgi:hypothetical protein
MLETALVAGWQPTIVATSFEHGEAVALLLGQHMANPVAVYEGSPSSISSGMVQPRLDAVVAEGVVPPMASQSSGRRSAIALACQDPNNTGTIVRTAVAMGMD